MFEQACEQRPALEHVQEQELEHAQPRPRREEVESETEEVLESDEAKKEAADSDSTPDVRVWAWESTEEAEIDPTSDCKIGRSTCITCNGKENGDDDEGGVPLTLWVERLCRITC